MWYILQAPSCHIKEEIEDFEYSDQNSDGAENQSEYEVSEEFMKFIETSLKHKEALKERKNN